MNFWDIFYNLCTERGLKPHPVAKELKIASGTVTQWKNGSVPNGETLIKLANYFNCSVDYLLGRSSENHNDIDFSGGGNIVHGSIVNGHSGNNSPLTINANATENSKNNTDEELLKLFHRLSFVKQAEIIVRMNEMIEEV